MKLKKQLKDHDDKKTKKKQKIKVMIRQNKTKKV